jgi:hypothetical protein
MIFEYNYYEYKVLLVTDPSVLDLTEKTEVYKKLQYINRKAKTNLKYGIFDDSVSLTDRLTLLNRMPFSIMFIDNEPVCFSYQYILDSKISGKPLVHQGLLVSNSSKNPGRDITIMNVISCHKYFEQNGEFFTTLLSSAPFAVGGFVRTFSNSWPSPFLGQKNPPEKDNYKKAAEECFQNYVRPFFPYPDNLSLDLKRFVVVSKALEMGFEVDMRKMSRDDDLMVNLFCHYWLDYEKQEIMLQVGKVDQDCHDRVEKLIKKCNIVFNKIEKLNF